jgi:hypothetical protein
MKTVEKVENYTTYELVKTGQFFFVCKPDSLRGYMDDRTMPLMKTNLDDLSVNLKNGELLGVDNKTMCHLSDYKLVEE